MSKFSNAATYVVRKLWTVVAITLVVFAILMSLLRYSLPLLNDKKHFFEDYVKSEYGVDLKIDSISASWQGVGPAIVLNKVALAQSDSSPISLHAESVYIEIHFWDSLLTQQVSSKNFSLEGLLIDLDLQRVQGESATDFPVVDALEVLFLEQLQRFSLVNSTLTIAGANNTQSFNIENLSWLNQGNRHQGSGLISVSELASNSAVFVIDLTGSANDFDGTIYAKADELDLSPWVNEFSALDRELREGRANFEFWADINRRTITKVFGNFSPSRFIWENEKVVNSVSASDATSSGPLISNTDSIRPLSIGIESGAFVAEPRTDKWVFNFKELALSVYDNTTITDWSGSYSKSGELLVQTTEPVALESLLQATSLFNSELSENLAQQAVTASLDSLYFQVRPAGIASYAEITDIAWNSSATIPGVDSLSAAVAWQKNAGAVLVSGRELNVATGEYFDHDFTVNEVGLPLHIYRDDEAWTIASKGLFVDSPDISISGDISYNIQLGELDLLANVAELPVSGLTRLLPNEPLLGSGVTDYLEKAFYGKGKIAGAQILWQGRFGDFPFENDNGLFEATVEIQDADFSFDDAWPSLTSLDLNLDFRDLGLTMTSESAQLGQLSLSKVFAYIPRLSGGADLIVEAQASGEASVFADVLTNSNLNKGIGNTLTYDILIEDEIALDLSLYVPLDEPAKTSASGRVALANNNIEIVSLGLKLNQANGSVTFDNDKVYFNDLSAQLLDQQVLVDFNGGQQESGYRFDVNARGSDWQLASLVPYVSEDFSRYLIGQVNWETAVNVSFIGEKYDYQATMFTDMLGVESTLPTPFDKAVDDKKLLKLTVNGNPQASTIKMSFGDDVNFDGILPHKEKQFSRAHLAIGNTDFVGRGVGFSISANLPEIELLEWYQTVAALISGAGESQNPIFGSPQRIFVETDNLIVAGQSILDVDATVKGQGKDWLVDLVSNQAKAQIVFHDRWIEEGIEIDAAFVYFDEWVGQEQTQKRDIDPQGLPRIRMKCGDCRVLGNELGRIDFESIPNDDGLRIERAIFDGRNGKIDLSGQWYKRNQDHYTFINGRLESKDFGEFLKDFKFDSGIKDSGAKMDFTVTWKDSPFDFTFDYLDGEIDWELSDGYITELSDKGSRIFTLLSLDSLVRKLSLDFRDVFAEGFFYDEMEGSIQILEGKADTRDTRIDGGAGELEIYGYTDLVSKELNYNVSFTPNVTGNLPVLVYFMVNPPTALAALALDQVLTSAKVISNINYSVTGTIAEPILLETGRKSTEVELPARRQDLQEDLDEEFIKPTSEDTLMMDVKDET